MIVMIFANLVFLISDNIIERKKANIINIKLLFINGVCMKNMTMAHIVKTVATPTLFRMLLPLSDALLLSVLVNAIKNKRLKIINNILSLSFKS